MAPESDVAKYRVASVPPSTTVIVLYTRADVWLLALAPDRDRAADAALFHKVPGRLWRLGWLALLAARSVPERQGRRA